MKSTWREEKGMTQVALSLEHAEWLASAAERAIGDVHRDHAQEAEAAIGALQEAIEAATAPPQTILNGVVFDVIVHRIERSDPASQWSVEVRVGGEGLMRGTNVPYADGLRTAANSMVTWMERNEET